MRSLQVCHLGKYYPPAPGPISSHVQTLARAQADLGLDVRVICANHLNREGLDISRRRHGATESIEEMDGNVQVLRVGRSASVARLDICPTLRHILDEMESLGVDVLHLHTPNPMMLMALAMARPRIPVVITHHCDIIRQPFLKCAITPFENFVY